MAVAGLTVDQIDAQLAELKTKKAKLAGMPDSFKIGSSSVSGVANAYQRVVDLIEELEREREALVENGGCPLPSRGEV